MKIHEYQAKELFRKYDIPVPFGKVIEFAEEAEDVAQGLRLPLILKAQVQVASRKKAGGILMAHSPEEAVTHAKNLLGKQIRELTVHKVLIEEALDIKHEYYLGIIVDRSRKRNIIMLSSMGGIDIEEVAKKDPEKIAKLVVEPAFGLLDFQIKKLCYQAQIEPYLLKDFIFFIKTLYKLFIDFDATLAEINPLVITADKQMLAADGKIDIDENALYRQPILLSLREELLEEENEIERIAKQKGISYVKLDGDIGIIGNGAGLVMATLDTVYEEKGRPANFLDIGGGAKADLVKNALELILMDKNVKGIFINIFGGITRCNEVAKGIIEAKKAIDLKVPLVVRLTGTNEEEGKKLLYEAEIMPARGMQEGAAEIVKLAYAQKK